MVASEKLALSASSAAFLLIAPVSPIVSVIVLRVYVEHMLAPILLFVFAPFGQRVHAAAPGVAPNLPGRGGGGHERGVSGDPSSFDQQHAHCGTVPAVIRLCERNPTWEHQKLRTGFSPWC